MLRKSFTLINNDNEYLRGDLRYREDARNVPTIIICHGFKGFKDWGFFPLLAETLANDGYASVTFNFSRNGIGSDFQNFTELDKFADNTYSHELADLDFIVSAIKDGQLGSGIIDPDKMGMLGHSRGGAIALLYCRDNTDISSLVTWSAIATVNRYDKESISLWKKSGYVEIENKRTKQIMRLNRSLIDDIEKNRKKLDIAEAAKNIDIPTLIIHGANDELVPVDEAWQIFESLSATDKEQVLIEDGSHTFNISHPLGNRSKQFETVLDLTESWFDKYLNY